MITNPQVKLKPEQIKNESKRNQNVKGNLILNKSDDFKFEVSR